MAALPNNTVSTPKAAAAPTEISVVDLILNTLDDAKAEETVSLDITGKSSLADHMIVTSGRSQRHVGAVADQVINALRDNGYGKPRVEGLPHYLFTQPHIHVVGTLWLRFIDSGYFD